MNLGRGLLPYVGTGIRQLAAEIYAAVSGFVFLEHGCIRACQNKASLAPSFARHRGPDRYLKNPARCVRGTNLHVWERSRHQSFCRISIWGPGAGRTSAVSCCLQALRQPCRGNTNHCTGPLSQRAKFRIPVPNDGTNPRAGFIRLLRAAKPAPIFRN